MNIPGENRPDPDELLAALAKEEEARNKGKLKIFFGMCAGVGKTFAMLKAAHTEKAKGTDIICGIIETHNRQETKDLTDGFETIPKKKIDYRSAVIGEMDLDAILARKPQLVLVDELAHTNVEGSRHAKRYQDVLEILNHGIHVYTTLNVQHLESRAETVAQITGIQVRETVPDEIFENAHEVELIDLTPEELLTRLSEGKVYNPERSEEAARNFFRIGNITALREMALRLVADRVDKQLHDYMQGQRIRGPWKSGMHLLVAINYHQQSARLLRWAKNLSYSMGAGIMALYVETPAKLHAKEQQQLDKNFKLAKQLGIPTRVVTSHDVAKAIVNVAQKENATHILVGKPRVRNYFTLLLLNNFVRKLIRYSGNIDVYILGSDSRSRDSYAASVSLPSFTSGIRQYLATSLLVILVSAATYLVRDLIGYQVVSFILLFLVSILAIFFGTGPILLASSLSAAIWNFFFIPPQFTFHISEAEDVLMFFMFFFIALLNGILTSRLRSQEKKIRIREERTHALYKLARELTVTSGLEQVTVTARNFLRKYFSMECTVLLKDRNDRLMEATVQEASLQLSGNDMTIAQWVLRNASRAGKFTDTLPSGEYTFYPLTGNSGTIGVIATRHIHPFTTGEEQFWEASISQISGKFEREYLHQAARNADVLRESEKLYKTLFNSISHELRIPVATVMAASDSLLTQELDSGIKKELYSEINIASVRLNRLIENLLCMSRLESGMLQPKPDWHDIHDLVQKVTSSLAAELSLFRLSVVFQPDIPMVWLDFGLTEQVLGNLILNATQHAPSGSTIRVKCFIDNNMLTIQVMDRGPGFPEQELESVFRKFYRGSHAKAGGTGLGLSIVKGFAEAQKGSVTARNRKTGGALFIVTLPQSADTSVNQ